MTATKQVNRRLKQRSVQDWRWVMSDARGRRVMFGLIADCGMFSCVGANVPDRVAAFEDGRRNVGLMLWAEIGQHAPERLLQMQAEAAQDAAEIRAEIEALAPGLTRNPDDDDTD